MKRFIVSICTIGLVAMSIQGFALPNPAAVNCTNQGYQYVLIKNTGICIFPDGSYCEEWSYFRGNCKAGKLKFPGGKWVKGKQAQYCVMRKNKRVRVKLCR